MTVTARSTMHLQWAADVRASMHRQGIDQKELARRLGQSPSWVSRLLNSRGNSTLRTVELVSEAVGLAPTLRLAETKRSYRCVCGSDNPGGCDAMGACRWSAPILP